MGLKRSRTDSLSSVEDPNSSHAREASADVKIVHLDAGTGRPAQRAVMKCSLPPHQPLDFASFEEYDVHYQKTHMNRCAECLRNFPDDHFLNLHIVENHDPINEAKKERGDKTYACLLPTCDRLCSTPQKRRLHCIDKHAFPRNYDFFIVDTGIDRRSSMLRPPHRRRSSTVNSFAEPGNRGHRRRSSTMGTGRSVNQVKGGPEDNMDLGEEDAERDGYKGCGVDRDSPQSPQRAPIKLRGRGGFGQGRGGVRGRGNRRNENTRLAVSERNAEFSSNAASESKTQPPPKAGEDPMEGLTSTMSALQFVPNSVRLAKQRDEQT